jgi:hypothetical protein
LLLSLAKLTGRLLLGGAAGRTAERTSAGFGPSIGILGDQSAFKKGKREEDEQKRGASFEKCKHHRFPYLLVESDSRGAALSCLAGMPVLLDP